MNDDPGWRQYQPSWPAALGVSFGVGGLLGGISYFQTGAPEVLGLAAIASGLFCAYLRWFQPRYRHLWWGDDD